MVKFMVKIGWKTENIIAASRNIHGEKPSKKQQLKVNILFRKGRNGFEYDKSLVEHHHNQFLNRNCSRFKKRAIDDSQQK